MFRHEREETAAAVAAATAVAKPKEAVEEEAVEEVVSRRFAVAAGAAGAAAAGAGAGTGDGDGASAAAKSVGTLTVTEHAPFGDGVVFADPSWYQGFATEHYGPSHAAYRKKVRAWVEKEVMPHVAEWDERGKMGEGIQKSAYEAGVFGIWPREYGGNGPEDADIFHHIVLNDELGRVGSGGFVAAVFTPTAIALPPVLSFGSEEMKKRVAPPCIKGEATISLAVTEPWAGSDVANIRTTARLSEDGKHYIVNGQKKFITGGGYASWFTTAVRTGDEDSGAGGISVLLIDAKTPGLKIRRMKTQGWWMSYTAHLTFEDVMVPVENLVGAENAGFMIVMENFNMERFSGVVMCLRHARVCYEDAVVYARKRTTFGKKLISHDVIRMKLADMAREIEAVQAWTEHAALQYKMGVNAMALGRTTALLKVSATRMLEHCAREASQILGGASYMRTGPGQRIERIYREVRVVAIGGGSEEILSLLGTRMAKL